MNCTPSGMQGAIWVMFTQTLICNDKVNDGAYFAIETNFPEGTIANLGSAEGSTAIAWAFLQPSFTGFPRTISRALQARGFVEEILSAYSVSGNVQQGGGIDQYGSSSAIMNFEVSAQGMGAKYVLDGTDYCAAMFNPEGDMGDVEMWELISPFVYLSRRVKASSAGPGRHRGGSSFESLFMVNKTPFWELQNIGTGRVLASGGLFGGYPGPTAYIHNIHGADLIDRARRGEAYPVADGDFESPALMEIQGSAREYKNDGMTLLSPFANGDLYLSVMKGGAGLGDPLLRPVEAVERDVREGHLLARFAESVYGVSDRDAYRRRRLSARDRGARLGRRRARAHPRPGHLAADQGDARRVDAPLPAVGSRVSRLLGPARRLRLRRRHAHGRGAPRRAGSHRSRRVRGRVPRAVPPARRARGRARRNGGSLDEETLQALVEERLTRREVKEIQSSYKDADRFQKWLSVLQRGVGYEDPIVLPAGEGLNIVKRRSDGEMVYRCDCGQDFCSHDRNWKMDAVVYVRESEQDDARDLPEDGGPRPVATADPRVLLPRLRPPAGGRSDPTRLPGGA